jgi:hypothetical protein
MNVAARAPDETAGVTLPLVVLQASFKHVSLFDCRVFMERDHRAGFHLDQQGGHPGFGIGVQRLELDAREG